MRCNVGINCDYLTDQWLIAEYRELPMVVGSLRINGWKIKSEPLKTFNLGVGHINWFKFRLHYLYRRHEAVKAEMSRRDFKCDVLSIKKDACPSEYWNDWNPTTEDSMKIRYRMEEKLRNGILPITWWRYKRVNLSAETLEPFLHRIINGEMYYV